LSIILKNDTGKGEEAGIIQLHHFKIAVRTFSYQVKEQLIRHIRQGNRKAFGEVFNQHFHALCAFGYRYIGDPPAVEDLVQEAFVAFWERRLDFDHPAAIKSYLYTSVRNKCLNHLKHEAVKKKHESALLYELESEQHYSRHVIEEESFGMLLEEIRKLPEASGEIMILALNGLKNPEIAEELGISVNTVKTQKKIAYAKLKDKLGPIMGLMLVFLMWR
jgi:RNA polymerase sigma-70 factor (ECF subfamily)